MMKQYKRLFLFFLAFVNTVFMLDATTRITHNGSDSLSYYLKEAGENNPELNAHFLSYKASLERINQAGAWSNPELEIGFFLNPMEIVGGRQVADITLMQMFPWFGTKQATRTEATHLAEMEYEKFRSARDELFLKVYTQWYTLGLLGHQLSYNIENKKLLEQLERLVNQQVSTQTSRGGTSMSDVIRIQLEVIEVDNNIESLRSQMKAQKAYFNALLNRPADSYVVAPDTLKKVQFLFSEMETVQTIKNNNPQLKMWQEEKLAFQTREEIGKKMGYPMIGIGLQYMMITKSPTPVVEQHNGMNMLMPMISISLPIFRGKYRSVINESRIMQKSAISRYNNTLNQLQSELYDFRYQLDNAERKIALYGKQKELATSAYRLLVQEFIADQSDLLNILEIQRQLLHYQLKEVEAIADYNTMVASIQRLRSFNNYNNKN